MALSAAIEMSRYFLFESSIDAIFRSASISRSNALTRSPDPLRFLASSMLSCIALTATPE